MNTSLITLARVAALGCAVLLAPALASASSSAAADPSVRALAATGSLSVNAAGPYVQVGSYRIHVASHLGRPSAVLPDGTWLYRHFTVTDSTATGTLVVRFDHGQVARLSLVSHAVEMAMLAPKPAGSTFVASR